MKTTATVAILAAMTTVAAADPFAERGASSAPTKLAVAPPSTAPTDPGHARKVAAKIVAAGGAALWLGAFAVGRYARGDYDAALADHSVPRTDAIARANHDWALAHYEATGLFVAGAAALGAAAYLYLGAPERSTVVAPLVANDGGGLAVVGRF